MVFGGSEQEWRGGETRRIACCRKADLTAQLAPHQQAILAMRSDLSRWATPVDLPTANHLPTTAKSKPTPPLASAACASSKRQAPTRADDVPVVQTAGDHADPGHPSVRLPAHRRAPRLHFGRTQRTRTRTDTGRRTLDTWTLGRPHRTLDTGGVDRHVWTLDARTEHWTPDAGRGRGQGDDGMAGIRAVLSHHAERSRAGTPVHAQACSYGRRP
jgi:hypothetical protein